MKFKPTQLLSPFAFCIFLSLFSSCKRDQAQQVKPIVTTQIADLKQFMANTGKVKLNEVDYDQNKDQFSIHGKAIITRANLQKFYDLNANAPKPQRFIMGQPLHASK